MTLYHDYGSLQGNLIIYIIVGVLHIVWVYWCLIKCKV